MSSQSILAVLAAADEADSGPPTLFEELGVHRSVVQKIQESISSDRPSIARPAREARDLFRKFEE